MHAFLSARPSFSRVMSWIATKTSAGVNAGPVCAEPCHDSFNLRNFRELKQKKKKTNKLSQLALEFHVFPLSKK